MNRAKNVITTMIKYSLNHHIYVQKNLVKMEHLPLINAMCTRKIWIISKCTQFSMEQPIKKMTHIRLNGVIIQ